MTGPAVLELDEAAAGAAIEALQAAARARRTPVDPPGERGDRPLVRRGCRVPRAEPAGSCRPCAPAAETASRRWGDWRAARQAATDTGPGPISVAADTGYHQDPAGHGLDALELLAARCEAAATGAAVVTVAADHHAPGPTAVDAEAAAGRVAEARAHLTDGGAG